MTLPANISQKFDYLIVGAGTAGTTLAAKLSENPNITVGLIEAGEYVTDMTDITVPGMAKKVRGNERIDWNFYTTSQVGCNGRKIVQPRGKLVGGSSGINYMVMGRGSREEYDALEALGNPGWNWNSLLPYMEQIEGSPELPPQLAKVYPEYRRDEHHKTSGLIKTSFPLYFYDLHMSFLNTVHKLGVPINLDPGNGVNWGALTGLNSIDPQTATRSYAATAFYEPNASRKNLVLFANTRATKVVFESENGALVATGVQVISDGDLCILSGGKEVILAAGSFGSPQLLELSGVTLNAEDHCFTPFVYEISNQYETLEVLGDPERFQQELKLQWCYADKSPINQSFLTYTFSQEFQQGMLTSLHSMYSYLPLDKVMSKEELALFLQQLNQDIGDADVFNQKKLGFIKEWIQTGKHAQIDPNFKAKENTHYHTILTGLLHPLSKGSSHIASSDPLVHPNIDPGYLKNPLDVQALVAGLRFCERIIGTAPYADAILKDNEKIEAFVREKVQPFHHQVGTASMLPQADGGVVDYNLKVYGTRNLRVVDASILPLEVSHHIQETVYAVALKAADLIISDSDK
ncbi:alcohol oxidase [Rhodocollybia butyracea]|uniref:Alcohol oxidase n=1 Tax=Rhodocollybia butyracea TaxID=206335 RepID=A0A9P5U1N4_9AGAR|nr:alcohol oxidase [Rhodocollybia butyracea]